MGSFKRLTTDNNIVLEQKRKKICQLIFLWRQEHHCEKILKVVHVRTSSLHAQTYNYPFFVKITCNQCTYSSYSGFTKYSLSKSNFLLFLHCDMAIVLKSFDEIWGSWLASRMNTLFVSTAHYVNVLAKASFSLIWKVAAATLVCNILNTACNHVLLQVLFMTTTWYSWP